MYKNYYSFQDSPFTIVPNPGRLFMSSKHKLAFAHLQYGLMEGTGIVVLTGGIGTGKTTLLRFLLGKIDRVMDVAVIFNTNVSGAELLRLIIREFEAGEPGEDKAANLAMLNDYLIERFRLGMQAVVIIDEAQNLSHEALEEVRLLSNLQGSTQPLLQVILAGQPELRRKLADPVLTQLAQRITSTFHLAPLDLDEARQYIRFRLTRAGGDPDLFDDEAVQAIHLAAGGVPRVMNILCNSCLVHGFADELSVITADVVAGVISEMGSMFQPSDSEEIESAPTRPAHDPDRLQAMEERLQTLEQKLAAANAETRVLQSELAALKETLAARITPQPEPVIIPDPPSVTEADSGFSEPSEPAQPQKPVSMAGRFWRFVVG